MVNLFYSVLVGLAESPRHNTGPSLHDLWVGHPVKPPLHWIEPESTVLFRRAKREAIEAGREPNSCEGP